MRQRDGEHLVRPATGIVTVLAVAYAALVKKTAGSAA